MRLVESLQVVKDGKSKFYLDGKRTSTQQFEEMKMFVIDCFNFSTTTKNGAVYYRKTLKIHSIGALEMKLKEIEAIENQLIKHVLATCWNFAEEVEDCEEYGCDIHNELFNLTHYTPSISVAESDTADLGVWNCVRLVQNYEETHFGEANTEIRPFQIANMVNYILGYHLLGKSEHLTQGDAWNRELTAKDRIIIQKELRAYIKGLVNWQQFWEEVLKEYDV